MRSLIRLGLAVLFLGGAAGAVAQDSDAGVPAEDAEAPDGEAKKEREPFIKRDGQTADNDQLGGEPSLTEAQDKASSVDDLPPEECDLDCIEVQLDAEKQGETRRKRTLEVARETGAVSSEDQTDAGDTLAAEPSTREVSQTDVAVPDEHKLPTRLGPVRVPVGKTDDWIGIGFAAQMEFAYDQTLEGAGFVRESTETLEFRRIRFTLSSSFIEGRIRSRFQFNLTPSAFELIDMWFAFTRFQFASFRIGQFKIPYDRYRAQSFASLSFVDWALTTRMFGSERQVGVEMLKTGGFLDLEYAIGVFSGVNARASHGVGISEVYGEQPVSASNFGFGEAVSAFHPEIAARVAKNFGEIDTATNSDLLRTKQLRHSLGTGIAWDARPDATEDLGLRLSGEWLGKIQGVHVNVVGYVAWYKPWQGGKILFGPLGVMAQTGYRFNLIWELAIRYSLVYLTPWLRSDARSYGEAQILSADPADEEQAITQYGRNGDETFVQNLGLAGAARVIGNSLKVVCEVAWERQLWNTGARNGVQLNMQLQLVF